MLSLFLYRNTYNQHNYLDFHDDQSKFLEDEDMECPICGRDKDDKETKCGIVCNLNDYDL